MTEEYKLQVSLELVDQLADLIQGNEYQQFFTQHIVSIRVELERQLTNLQYHSKIEE